MESSDKAASAPPLAGPSNNMPLASVILPTEGADYALTVQPSVQYVPLNKVHEVGWFSSISTQLRILFFALLSGLVVSIIVTLVLLQSEGAGWSDSTGDSLLAQQKDTLVSLSTSQAAFTRVFFQQLALDLAVSGAVAVDVLLHRLNQPQFPTAGTYAQSYSIDLYNPSSVNYASSMFGGYFIPSDAGCQTTNSCGVTLNSNETKLLSLLDAKLLSSFHAGAIVTFNQLALDGDGLSKYYPYASDTTHSSPVSCPISDTTQLQCGAHYYASSCSTSYSGPFLLYPYDPRCRSWYGLALRSVSHPGPSFDYPRVTSSGEYVLTGVAPLLSSTGSFLGALNSNYLISALSSQVNAIKFLSSGYVYVIDATSPGQLIVHPRASSSCSAVSCAEAFSSSGEYQSFYDSYLVGIQTGALSQQTVFSYHKGGQTWLFAYSAVNTSSVSYALLSTVRLDDVLSTVNSIKSTISSTITRLIIAFVFVIAVLMGVFWCVTAQLVRAIVDPIHDVQLVLSRVKDSDLSGQVPTEASSADMKVLLGAFTNLMIALRFDSDSYAKGNATRAREVFHDALTLFNSINNLRGIGIALNNLGAVATQAHSEYSAKSYYEQAIQNAEQILSTPGLSAEKAAKARRTLSDRKGNLAVALLEQKAGPEAFEILEKVLIEDKTNFYIRGCVVKQGTLGQFYLKQGEVASAERIFVSALSFLRGLDPNAFSVDQWSREETDAAEQIALSNLASLAEAKERSPTEIEEAYVLALTHTPIMHTATVRQLLGKLKGHFETQGRSDEAAAVLKLATDFAFNLAETVGAVRVPKNLMFALDYSGSMAGMKIRSATENLLTLFNSHSHDDDYIGVMTFNQWVTTNLELTRKQGNSAHIMQLISSLSRPGGGTALYDAVSAASKKLVAAPARGDNWLVVLTDGADGNSKLSIDSLCQELRIFEMQFIIIGIGSDVETQLLRRISKSAKKGMYFAASADKSSIDETFVKVAAAIQGQLIMEEF